MDTKRSNNKLKINIISSSAYQVLVMIVPIITTPYVTRIFNADQMGIYSLSLTVSSLFVVIAQFGLPTYGSREIATLENTKDTSKVFFYLGSLQIVTSLIAFVIYNILFLYLLDFENKLLFFIQSLLIVINIFDISWLYVGLEEIGKVIVRNALSKILTTFSIFILIKNDNQLELYAFLNVVGMFIGNLSMILQSGRYVDYSFRKFMIKKKHLNNSFRLLVPVLVNTSYDSAEKTILSVITSTKDVGIYSEAKKIINLAASVINSAFNALSPRMSYYVSTGEFKKMNVIFNKGLLSSSIFSIFMVGGVFAVAEDFVSFFYGMGYENVKNVLMISSLSLILIPIIVLISRGILIPYGKDTEYTNSIMIVLISGIIMNLLLDKQLGAIGAAISFLITQFLSLLYVVVIVKDIISIRVVMKNLLITIFSITINIFGVFNVAHLITFENPFLAFLFNGIVSVGINMIVLLFFYPILKREK